MLRLALLLVLLPSVAAQAPTLTATVSTGEFVIDGTASFEVTGTFVCEAFDADPDVIYTLPFAATHYTSGDADPAGVAIATPEPITLRAPCFPDGLVQQTHPWTATFTVTDINATPGAMYHMDIRIEPSAAGRFGQEAPASLGVHTMGSAPQVAALPEPVVPASKPAPGPALGMAILALFLARR